MWQSLLDRLLRCKLSKDIRKKFLEVISVDIWLLSSSSQFDVIHRVSLIHRVSYPDDDDMKNSTACIIMKYIRLVRAYLLAYDKGLDIVAAEEWLKQRRSHKGYSGQMGDVLEKLYFPCGRSGEASDVEVDNIENYGDVVEAMLLLGATPDIELVENAVDDDYHDYVYGEDDDTRNCMMME